MKKTVIIIAIFILILFIGLVFLPQSKESSFVMDISKVKIGERVFEVDLAQTPEEEAQGLSGRESLEENRGLLFIFDTPGFYEFWMKDMNFPIDMIWIDENNSVSGLKEEALPSSYPETFAPASLSSYVLEVNAGVIRQENIKIGDSVTFVK